MPGMMNLFSRPEILIPVILGKTAFFGWKEFAQPKKGETVYISTGAGTVGS